MPKTRQKCACRVKERRCKNSALPGSEFCRTHAAGTCQRFGSAPASKKKRGSSSGTPKSKGPSGASFKPTPTKRAAPVAAFVPGWARLKKDSDERHLVKPGLALHLKSGDYVVEKRLGAGSFGVVVLAVKDGVRYAIKLGKDTLDRIVTEWGGGPFREFEMMDRVSRLMPVAPKIYDYGSFGETAGAASSSPQYPYAVMELFEGDGWHLLERIVRKTFSPVAGEESMIPSALAGYAFISYQLAKQIKFLEDRGIYHIDIKFGNMIYKLEGPLSLRLSITDFGMTCDGTPGFVCLTSGTCVPPEWAGRMVRETGDVEELRRAQRYVVGETIRGAFRADIKMFREPHVDAEMIGLMAQMLRAADDLAAARPEDRPDDGYSRVMAAARQLIEVIRKKHPSSEVFHNSMNVW